MEVEKKKIVSYKDLEVWKKGVRFTIEIYRITSEFPSREQFGLTNQLRRAASSIPANIAEGYGRESTKNYIQFLKTARGSLNEVETFLYIGFELEYLNKQALDNLIIKTTELGKMMNSLIKKLNPNPTA
jgi:four helix bundle protein